MNKLLLILLTASVLVGARANAIVELRLGYGGFLAQTKLSDLYNTALTVPSATIAYGLGGDVIVSLPLMNTGIGLRQENLSFTASNSDLEYSNSFSRTSVILNYRLWDTLFFVGPILTYGITHSGSLTVKAAGTEVAKYSDGTFNSYTYGLEAGVKLLGFLVGVEAGNQVFRWDQANDTVGGNGKKDINLDGTYTKLLIGFKI